MSGKYQPKAHSNHNRKPNTVQYNNFIAAVSPNDTSSSRQRSSTIVDPAAIMIIPSSVHTDEPLHGRDGSVEKTTSIDRSFALLARLIPFSIIWLVLAIGVSWTFALEEGVVFVLFALLTALTYYHMDRQEREFSRNGLERHRINTLALLKLAEMDHQQQLRKMALSAHLKLLGGNYDTTR